MAAQKLYKGDKKQPKQPKQPGQGQKKKRGSGPRKFSGECWNCGEVGHIRDKCPHPEKEEGYVRTVQGVSEESRESKNFETPFFL